MKTRIFTALILASPFLVHAQAPSADDQPCRAEMGHNRPHHGDQRGMPPFLHELELSEAQQDKIFELMHQQAPVMREKAKAADQAKAALHQLALAENYNESQARTLAQSAANAESEMALLRIRNEQKIYTLLTAEQRQRFATNISSKKKMQH
jgi:periplasmic protein CpxP/Spy